MKNDLISVIVTIYNIEEYIEECIDSIINQTYKNLEIILIDDGSTDNSGKKCDEFAKKDNRIKVIHKKNGGVSDARNVGIDIARGAYIQFIDGDDYIEKDMIEFLYYNIQKYSADISICSNYIFDEEECIDKGQNKLYIYDRLEAIKETLIDEKICSYLWNKLFKADLMKDIRFPKNRLFEDLLVFPKLVERASKIVLDDVAKYYYRQRTGSILHKQSKELRLAYINAALEVIEYLKLKAPELEVYFAYNYAHITIKTFNDIGLFHMRDMLNEKMINELYTNTCKIFENKEYEKAIVENSSFIKKLHYYYLISDKEGYINNHNKLPVLYPGWKSK